jgi:hypothetical protein
MAGRVDVESWHGVSKDAAVISRAVAGDAEDKSLISVMILYVMNALVYARLACMTSLLASCRPADLLK